MWFVKSTCRSRHTVKFGIFVTLQVYQHTGLEWEVGGFVM